MPLDTTLYPLTHLRPDGRRWNELRLLTAQTSTHPTFDGSSHYSHGNTTILCTITGPTESRNAQRREGPARSNAAIEVEVRQAGFAGTDRKKRVGKGDRRVMEVQRLVGEAMETVCFVGLYPHSTINVTLHVLSLDGGLLAGCINAATLAMVDAGVPMRDYVCAVSCGLSPLAPMTLRTGRETRDPLLDLSGGEELEVPFLTVATVGKEGDRVVVLSLERRVAMEDVEGMLATGVDGCKRVREILDGVVRENGERVVKEGGG